MLTSGTLAPLRTWESELKLPFPVQFINNHVVDVKSNLLAAILLKGPTGQPFNFGFQNKDNMSVYNEIGQSLLLLCQKIPNGVLVVFSSTQVLHRCLQQWHKPELQIYKKLNDVKQIFEEPRIGADLDQLMHNYR